MKKIIPNLGALLLCTLSVLTSIFIPAHAQQLNALKSLPAENPLSYQAIMTMAQDSDGFMWFGTQNGLHRYDGYELNSFVHDNRDESTLTSSDVSALLVDRSGKIWAGTRAGLNLFDPGSQNFQRFTTTSKSLTLSDDNINALLEDSNGNIWIATDNGLNILFRDQQPWTIKPILHSASDIRTLSHNNVKDLVQSATGTIWAATHDGISEFDLQGSFIKTVKPIQQNIDNPSTKLAKTLHMAKNGDIWIGTTGGGLLKFDHISDDFSHYQFDKDNPTSIPSNTISKIYQDASDRLWVATDKGLSIYNRQEDKFYRYVHSATDPNSLANNVVLTVFEDSQKIMWIGTFAGVSIWNPNVTTFDQYSPQKYPQMTDSHISAFSQVVKNQVYFATYGGGIYRLTQSDRTIEKMPQSDYFKDLSITSILAEKEVLWIGTRASGMHIVDLVSNEITANKNDPNDENSISANSITSIIRDKHNNIWISTFHKGINRLNKNGSFTRFVSTDPVSNNGPSINNVLQIMEDTQGYLWLATYGGGINRFNPATKTFMHLSHDDTKPDSLSHDNAWFVFQDDMNNLWIGTRGFGLNKLSFEDQKNDNFVFTHLDIEDGMNNRTVAGISQDKDGNIWFATSVGISRYSQTNNSFKHFNATHGLLDPEINFGAIYRSDENRLFFGTTKGFNTILPTDLELSQSAPQVRMTEILKLNEPMRFDQAISKIDSLTFDYSDRLISFEYVGLNYADSASTNYQYRLHGFDQEWIDAGKLKRATYTNLPSGTYQLEVKAANSDNVWPEQGLMMEVIIEPAPWASWWAYLLYTILTAMALLTYSKVVNRKFQIEQQQKIMLKQQVEEQTKEFQLKNVELEHANVKLENAATTDKLTGVRSRRYLDIYIEQATRLMSQIHLNILPVQRNILPRLYLFMVRINDVSKVSNSQLVNLTDLLLYSRNDDDLVIRWSDDTFAVIGYEKEQNARELASRLSSRFGNIFDVNTKVDMAYSFYPFNFEQPMALSWDQVSVLTEFGLNHVSKNESMQWLGLYSPKTQPFNYLEAIKLKDLAELGTMITIKPN